MNPVIEDYEFLSSITGQMRIAAIEGEWNHLIELEKQCSQRVARMKSRDADAAPAPLDEASRLRKVSLIRKILDDDAEIRNRAQPRLAELQRLIQGISQERRVRQTYSG